MIAAAIVLVLAGPGEPPRQRVAVAELSVEGEDAQQSGVAERIAAALGRGRYELVTLDDPCRDAVCWREAAKREGSLFVVVPKLRREASDHAIAIDVIDATDGSVVSEASDTCDLCGRSELLDLAGDLADKTRKRLDRLAGEPGELAIASSPDGATVSVDGEVVGTTPLRHAMSPGAHEITIALPGHQSIVRRTEILGGTQESMRFELVPLPSAGAPAREPADTRGKTPLVGAGAGLLAAGLVGVGVGAALLAIHAEPIENDCTAANVDPDGDCRFLHDTRGGGIAALALGGAGVVAGAVLLGLGLRHRDPRVRASASPRSVALEVRF